MEGATEPKKENYVQAPQWYFRQFLPNARSLAQVKIIGEIINQTRGYHKPEDVSSLTRLAKSVKMSRSTVSAHIQILLKVGVIQMKNELGDELTDPKIRKQSGIKRLKTIFVIPTSLVLSEDKLQHLQVPRKNFALVLSRDKNLSNDTASKRLIIRHNKRNNPKEIITKERDSDASHLHSHKLVPPDKDNSGEEEPIREIVYCELCGEKMSPSNVKYAREYFIMMVCYHCRNKV